MDLYLEVRKMYCRSKANQALGNFELVPAQRSP